MAEEPIWARSAPSDARATLTRERIAEAAIALADAEGPGAISMRRIAAELDVGTMTLYGYVNTKDELMTLVNDTLMAELLIPEDEFPDGDWRAALAEIAERTRATFTAHPWVLAAGGSVGSSIGPNGLRHFEQTLRAVRDLRLDPVDKLDITGLVDEYVFGYLFRKSFDVAVRGEVDAAKAYVEDQLKTDDYPYFLEVFPAPAARDYWWDAWAETDFGRLEHGRFRLGVQRLLDGIEADLVRRGVL